MLIFRLDLEYIYYMLIEIFKCLNYLLFLQEIYDLKKVKGFLLFGGIEESSELCYVELKNF